MTDFKFEACESCASIDHCEARCSCFIDEVLSENIAKHRGELPEQIWEDAE